MKLHLFDGDDPGHGSGDERVMAHMEFALAVGEGGSLAWQKLSVDDNLTAIEAALASLDVDLQKLRDPQADTGHPDWKHDMRAAECALELHVWRRCFHLTQRFRDPLVRIPQAEVTRFIAAVTAMQALLRRCDRHLEGHLSVGGIALRAETSTQVMRLLQERGGGDAERVASA